LDPLGTVTDWGTVAAELVEDRATEAPFAPALVESVTLPVEEEPPVTEVGDSVSLVTDCASDKCVAARNAIAQTASLAPPRVETALKFRNPFRIRNLETKLMEHADRHW